MLYISRQVGEDDFGVVDTDDGVEQAISFSGICHCVSELGLSIAGVATEELPFGRFVHDITVYQPEWSLSREQVRLQLLLNVSIVVYKSMITKIAWDADKILKPVTIRLSDFGTQLGKNILLGNKFVGRHVITLVLDDKLQHNDEDSGYVGFPEGLLIGDTDLGVNGMGVMFDLRELSNSSVVRLLYDGLYSMAFRGDISEMRASILDNEVRKNLLIPLITAQDAL